MSWVGVDPVTDGFKVHMLRQHVYLTEDRKMTKNYFPETPRTVPDTCLSHQIIPGNEHDFSGRSLLNKQCRHRSDCSKEQSDQSLHSLPL